MMRSHHRSVFGDLIHEAVILVYWLQKAVLSREWSKIERDDVIFGKHDTALNDIIDGHRCCVIISIKLVII